MRNALDRSFGLGTHQHCEIVTVWTLWVRRFLLRASTVVENDHPISLICICIPNTWLTLTFQFKMTAESWPMESCTGQWLPGFPYAESVHSSRHWIQNIFSGFFVLDIIPWRGKAASVCCWVWTEPRCGLPENLSFTKVLWNWGCGGGDASVMVDVPLFILQQFDWGLCFGEQTNWAFVDFCLCLCSNLDERQSFFEGASRSPVVCC